MANKKIVIKKLQPQPVTEFFGFSSLKRVLGSLVTFQSAVNAYAALVIALVTIIIIKNFFFGGGVESEIEIK